MVTVLEKRGHNNVLVKSFGSSRDKKEIERMVEQARIYIQQQTGTYYHLCNQPPEQGIEDFVDGLTNSQISVEGLELIHTYLSDDASASRVRPSLQQYTCSSRILRDIFDARKDANKSLFA